MIASEFIVELQRLIAEHGDLELEDEDGCVVDVEFNNDDEDNPPVFLVG